MSLQGYNVFFNLKKGTSVSQSDRYYKIVKIEQLCNLLSDASVSANLPNHDIDYCSRQIKAALSSICNGIKFRVICAPSIELKSRQAGILKTLQRIPVHRGAHGFVRGRNSLSCAQAHLSYWGQSPKGLVLLNADVSGFFHSISKDLVITSLNKHGVALDSANSIAEQCMIKLGDQASIECIRALLHLFKASKELTNSIIGRLKETLDKHISALDVYTFMISKTLLGIGNNIGPGDWFLPQGAPTSPVLSNLVCKIIDIRLAAMAKAFGAYYTRYADDITFSWKVFTKGKVIDGLKRCSELVFAEYGFEYNPNKIRVIGPGGAQDIVGFVINSGKPTVSQKFRKEMRKTIATELKSKSPTRPEVINRLTGQAGYIQPLHTHEALWMKAEIIKLQHKTNRKVVTHTHGEEFFESPSAKVSRKVTVLS